MIGVDVGGTKILAGLVARDGTVVGHREYPTPIENEDALLDGLEAAVREFLDESVVAVGFGIPSQIDQRHGIALGSVNIPLRGVPFRQEMADRLGLAIGIDNDANAAAIAEWKAGAGRGTTDMIMLTLGTGVGGGLILGGKPYRGWFGAGAEIGHMVIVHDGLPCRCWRARASGVVCVGQGRGRARRRGVRAGRRRAPPRPPRRARGIRSPSGS